MLPSATRSAVKEVGWICRNIYVPLIFADSTAQRVLFPAKYVFSHLIYELWLLKSLDSKFPKSQLKQEFFIILHCLLRIKYQYFRQLNAKSTKLTSVCVVYYSKLSHIFGKKFREIEDIWYANLRSRMLS